MILESLTEVYLLLSPSKFMKIRAITIFKLHCGFSGVHCHCSFLDRHVLPDTDALRNPQRQLASDR